MERINFEPRSMGYIRNFVGVIVEKPFLLNPIRMMPPMYANIAEELGESNANVLRLLHKQIASSNGVNYSPDYLLPATVIYLLQSSIPYDISRLAVYDQSKGGMLTDGKLDALKVVELQKSKGLYTFTNGLDVDTVPNVNVKTVVRGLGL